MVSSFRVVLGVSLVGAAIVVTACGDDDSGGVTSTGGSATTGGAGSGGAKASGGQGGATGGAVSTGGKGATGGAAPAGGAPPTGGVAATGGKASGGTASAGSAGATEPGGAGGSVDGGSGGAGDEEIGGTAGVPNEPEGDPILEQPVEGGYDCELDAPLVLPQLSPDGALVAGAAPSLFWNEVQSELIRGALLEGTTAGTPFTLRDPAPVDAATVAAARNGDRITVIWQDLDGEARRLFSAQVDDSGDGVTEAHALPGTAPNSSAGAIVSFGDGYAAVWAEGFGDDTAYKFARLDAAGNLVGSPKTLLDGRVSRVDSLVALEDGFAMTYTAFEGTQSSRFVAFDAEGTPYREPITLGEPGAGLIRRGDYVVAAWVHGSGDRGSAWAGNLRIGRFDDRGRAAGDVYELQEAVVHEQNSDPAWVELGDDLGLVWSRGSVIYVCGGCIPDDHLEFVVLDGRTLAKKSQVVTIENQETTGGLLRSQIVANESGLTVATNVTYHVSAEAGLATISCTP
jgi:hypothetical protein